MRNLCAVTVMSVALCSAAQGQPSTTNQADMPRYERGQTFIFDNGRVERVEAINGDRITWAARSGRTYERSANPVVPILRWSFRGQAGTRDVRGEPHRLWPLRTGASVQFQTVNVASEEKGAARRSLHLWTCRVRAQETVALRNGPIKAIPIQCDRFSAGTMRVLERITWHYSPEVGHYVRREARDMRDGVAEVITLYATLSPREANAVRIEAVAQQAAAKR